MATKIINIIRTAPIANGIHIGQKHHHQDISIISVNLRMHKRIVIPIFHPPILMENFPSCIF